MCVCVCVFKRISCFAKFEGAVSRDLTQASHTGVASALLKAGADVDT